MSALESANNAKTLLTRIYSQQGNNDPRLITVIQRSTPIREMLESIVGEYEKQRQGEITTFQLALNPGNSKIVSAFNTLTGKTKIPQKLQDKKLRLSVDLLTGTPDDELPQVRLGLDKGPCVFNDQQLLIHVQADKIKVEERSNKSFENGSQVRETELTGPDSIDQCKDKIIRWMAETLSPQDVLSSIENGYHTYRFRMGGGVTETI